MHYHGHRARLRERLAKNADDLADYEILELLLAQAVLRKDTKPLAKELLTRFHTLRGVLDARPSELACVPGFGPGLAHFWRLVRECLARYAEGPLRQHEVLASAEAVAEMAGRRLAGQSHEEVWAAYVDSQNRLLSWERICTGTVDASPVFPRDIMEFALRCKASAFFLVHNHPGGRPYASQSDLEATRKVLECAKVLDIRLLDHIIVSDQGWSSLALSNLL